MTDREYLLGTHDEEIARLGLQHAVWRSRAMEAWRRAGFTRAQNLLDLGCGPGYATLDLIDIVGPAGSVHAIDRSQRFLAHLGVVAQARGIDNITTALIDFDADPLPCADLDGAWVRWVFAFLQRPRDLVQRLAGCLRMGGTVVVHEYFDYATWRLAPRLPELEEFVQATVKSWRDSGGEPDIGLELPSWFMQSGFELVAVRPLIDVVHATDFMWHWPRRFIETYTDRLVESGYLDAARARAIREAFADAERRPEALMITPAVLEIIARRS